jgi:hypothetical protein
MLLLGLPLLRAFWKEWSLNVNGKLQDVIPRRLRT